MTHHYPPRRRLPADEPPAVSPALRLWACAFAFLAFAAAIVAAAAGWGTALKVAAAVYVGLIAALVVWDQVLQRRFQRERVQTPLGSRRLP